MKFTVKAYNNLIDEWLDIFEHSKDPKHTRDYWLEHYHTVYKCNMNAVKAYTTPVKGYHTMGIVFGFPEIEFYNDALENQFEAMAIGDAYEKFVIKKFNDFKARFGDISPILLRQLNE